MPEPWITLLLLLTGMLAGMSNAIAGGGTFFTFPAFLASGIAPVVANASNAVAVWPGHALAVVGYRRELARFSTSIIGSVIIALSGGIVGALLLVYVGNTAFSKLIPFLILFATLLFGAGGNLGFRLSARTFGADSMRPTLVRRLVEFSFAVYGGCFGAGLGIMLMAGLLILGVRDLQANNALKNLLAAAINTVAVLVLAVLGLVSWPLAAVAFIGAMLGGLLGARVARVLPAVWLRRVVVAVGLVLSVYYFGKYYDLGV